MASLKFHKTMAIAFNKSTNKKEPKTSTTKIVDMAEMRTNLTSGEIRISNKNSRPKRMLEIAGISKMDKITIIKCYRETIMASSNITAVGIGEGITTRVDMAISITMVIRHTMASMIISSTITRLAMTGNMKVNSKTTPMMATKTMGVVAIIITITRTIEEWEATVMTSTISNSSLALMTIEVVTNIITIRPSTTIKEIAITTGTKTTRITAEASSSSLGTITNRQDSSKSSHLPSSTTRPQLLPLSRKASRHRHPSHKITIKAAIPLPQTPSQCQVEAPTKPPNPPSKPRQSPPPSFIQSSSMIHSLTTSSKQNSPIRSLWANHQVVATV